MIRRFLNRIDRLMVLSMNIGFNEGTMRLFSQINALEGIPKIREDRNRMVREYNALKFWWQKRKGEW